MSDETGAPGGPAGGTPPYNYPQGPYLPAPQPYWGYRPFPVAPQNGLGVASLVVGIVALLATVTVVGGVILGFLAVIMGGAARAKVRRGQATNGGVAAAGIVLGVLAAVIPTVLVVWLTFGTDAFNEDYQHCIGYHPNDEQACERYR
jgi:Domain of unknown function (DUF4190)